MKQTRRIQRLHETHVARSLKTESGRTPVVTDKHLRTEVIKNDNAGWTGADTAT